MNNFLLIIASILVLVLTALFAIPPMIDWNDFRGAFEEEASRMLDRQVRVRGQVSVRILPIPYVSFEKVRIADAPGVPGSIAQAEQFKMWLSVPPLLRGIFEARQIEVERPVIRMRTEPDGAGNWSKLQIQKSGLPYIPSDVALNSVRISDGTLLFESHRGLQIAKLTKITGEMTASTLQGPYKFIGTLPLGGVEHEARLSTARMDETGEVRFSGSLRAGVTSTTYSVNGTLFDLLGSARAEGRLISRGRPQGAATGGSSRRRELGYELTANIKLDAKAFRLNDIAISFHDKDRQQTLNGSAITSWRDGVVTETNLTARWLDLDAIAGTEPGEGPLQVVERLLTRGIEPLGAGVTSVRLGIDQANLAGTSVGDLKGRMLRRDGVTRIESLRASLPGRSALAIDGFIERRKSGLQFDGNVLVRSASFAELAQWAQLGLSKDAESNLATSFSLNGALRVRPKSLELSEARIALADAVAEGSVSYSWSGRPALIVVADANTLNLASFGQNLLAPSRIAGFIGLTADGKRSKQAAWQDGKDIAIQLHAGQLSDGTRRFSDVDIDFGRTGDVAQFTKFNAIWEPGLKLALSGRLAGLKKDPSGTITGTVAAANDVAGANLARLLGLANGDKLPENLTVGRTPLRVAFTAELGSSTSKTAEGKPRISTIVADGTLGPDHIRIDARTYGKIINWRKQPAHIQARLTGADALATTGRLLGQASRANSNKPGAVTRAGADEQPKPVAVVMTAVGTPAKGMKSFLRLAAGRYLNVDYSGELRIVPVAQQLTASWSGDLDVRNASARTLAMLAWPALRGHVANMPVRGRVAVASAGSGVVSLKPVQLMIGGSRISGDLNFAAEAGNLAGKLTLSSASIPTLAGLLLRRPASAAQATDDDRQWTDTPFDFRHLAGINTDLDVKVRRLTMSDENRSRLHSAAFKLAIGPSRISVRDFSARLGKANLKATLDLEKSQAGLKVNARLSGTRFPLRRWAPNLAREKRLTGTANFKFDLKGQSLSPRSLSSVIAGSGEFKLSGATVPGMTSQVVTAAARRIIDGEVELDDLKQNLTEHMQSGAIELGGPTLKVRIADGTLAFPPIVFDLQEGGLRNATFVDLSRWRIDSQWTITPAPQPQPDAPDQTVPLPSVSLVYAGSLSRFGQIEPKLELGDLERELVVRKMEANVARLEQLRREDEARAAAERERQRLIEEARRRSIEEEQRRRWQPSTPGVNSNGTQLPPANRATNSDGAVTPPATPLQPPAPQPAVPGALQNGPGKQSSVVPAAPQTEPTLSAATPPQASRPRRPRRRIRRPKKQDDLLVGPQQ
jgi:uncharacterized protein involved in outer membrane biogenesis